MNWLTDYYNGRIVGQYVDQCADGLTNSLVAAGVSLVFSVALGVPVALARMARRAPIWRLAAGYIQFIRATPLLVQIYLVYYALPVFIPAAKSWSELILGIVEIGRAHV